MKCNICCTEEICHIRKSMCSKCYSLDRKEQWELNQEKRLTVPGYKENRLFMKRKRHVRKIYIPKQCSCGKSVIKGSRKLLCTECSFKDSSVKKIKYQLKRKKSHFNTKIRENIKCRLSRALFKNKKDISIISILGCPIEELKLHLESKFYYNCETNETMTWDNYGFYGWHIDHIKPLSSFNLLNKEELLKACHYTNLQPLWAKDNLRKGSKYEL